MQTNGFYFLITDVERAKKDWSEVYKCLVINYHFIINVTILNCNILNFFLFYISQQFNFVNDFPKVYEEYEASQPSCEPRSVSR